MQLNLEDLPVITIERFNNSRGESHWIDPPIRSRSESLLDDLLGVEAAVSAASSLGSTRVSRVGDGVLAIANFCISDATSQRIQRCTGCPPRQVKRATARLSIHEPRDSLALSTLNSQLSTINALLRRVRYPPTNTERSEHNFHCQRTKDESHYSDEDRRALPADHPQNRIRKKQ
jgi:hypothetical protein